MLIFLVLISLFPASILGIAVAAGGTGPFPDVSGDYVNAQAIDYLKNAGVVSGYPDGTYKPTDEINRAEFTKIIVGSLYTDVKGKNCFPDVKDEWFAPYVCTAKADGIIAGYPDGTFKPNDKINFSEASKIVANAYKISGTASGGQWFQPFVTALESKNDIPLSVENFDQNVTRDQMAEMVYRLKANVTDKATRTYNEIKGQGFVTVNSCATLKERFVEQGQYNGSTGGLGGGESTGVMMPVMEQAPAPAPTAVPVSATTGGGNSATKAADYTSSGAATDFSTTNLQVQGVDEGDVIKNDGRYIYFIKGNTIRIIDAYPADNMKELISFSLGDNSETFNPSEMYVDGNYLTVVGSASISYPQPIPLDSSTQVETTMVKSSMPVDVYPYFGYSRTKVYVVDITDRSKPTVARSVEFDGSYNSSRKVGDTLYMVMNQYVNYPYYYAQPMMLDTSAVSAPGTSAAGVSTSTSASAPVEPPDAIVPKMLDTKVGSEQLIAPCSDIKIIPKPRNFNYIITAAVPLVDKTKDVTRSVIVGDSGDIYASTDSLYVASTDWGDGFYRPYGDYDTMVYRFALGDAQIMFKNAGTVPGTILNQFSMDEYNGYFRIATTKNEYVMGSEINNNVYVLNSAMQVVGKIEKIAPGEKLYSTRFMGKTAFMVTFKRVDPFFVLDLSDPKNPVIKGTLKIPGYSTYLQPYDDTHIIGFGNEVDPKYADTDLDSLPYDALLGMKISLFDITDLSNPKEMSKDVIGDRGTYSDVLYNHKALLFDHDKGLMVFPVTVYEVPQQTACSDYKYSTCPTDCMKSCVPTSCTDENGIRVCTPDCEGPDSCVSTGAAYGKPVFDGAYVYNVNLTDGFTLKGKVSHYSDADQTALQTNGYTDYEKTIQRAMYIGEYLYTVSQSAVKANLLSDLSEKNLIQLAGDIWNIYYGKG